MIIINRAGYLIFDRLGRKAARYQFKQHKARVGCSEGKYGLVDRACYFIRKMRSLFRINYLIDLDRKESALKKEVNVVYLGEEVRAMMNISNKDGDIKELASTLANRRMCARIIDKYEGSPKFRGQINFHRHDWKS